MLRSPKLACKSLRKSYVLVNMVKKPTCLQNLAKPTCIDLIIKNKTGMFQNAKTYQTGRFHKLVISIMKLSYNFLKEKKPFSREAYNKQRNYRL